MVVHIEKLVLHYKDCQKFKTIRQKVWQTSFAGQGKGGHRSLVDKYMRAQLDPAGQWSSG
eukprot:10742821-Ditylum_brightwellii.AAC.1